MSVTVGLSDEARRDLKRLAKWRPSYAAELIDLLCDELAEHGCVPDGYAPHVLDNPREPYSGCMEFHFMDDVLVLYYPPKPHGFVRVLHVCTHDELREGKCGNEWPR